MAIVTPVTHPPYRRTAVPPHRPTPPHPTHARTRTRTRLPPHPKTPSPRRPRQQAVVDTAVVALSAADLEPSSSSSSPASAAAGHLGLDLAALQGGASPCALQLVLLPFGEDKRDLEDYKRYDVRGWCWGGGCVGV